LCKILSKYLKIEISDVIFGVSFQVISMNILVLNSGSSSVKFQLIATDLARIEANADRRLARGTAERIGGMSIVTLEAEGAEAQRQAVVLRDTRAAIDHFVRWACAPDSGVPDVQAIGDVHAIGHRVVHGGERFTHSALITDDVLRGIEDCIDLAPLHNPANIRGIKAAREIFGAGLPQAAVFDTAFHQTLPPAAYLYALPYQLYRRHRLRRYGFHGTSHRYVAYRYRTMLGLPRDATNVITLHLGNGCSAAAIKGGNSIDTSMGLTPLEGLVMGTRSGDIDPAIIDYLAAKEGMTIPEIETLLNKQSGLLGISGLTNDMRELLAEAGETGDRRASLAVEVFCYRARKYIGAYLAAMNGADASSLPAASAKTRQEVRAQICDGLQWLGLELDEERNHEMAAGREGKISRDDSS
jgi:acetate kinase